MGGGPGRDAKGHGSRGKRGGGAKSTGGRDVVAGADEGGGELGDEGSGLEVDGEGLRKMVEMRVSPVEKIWVEVSKRHSLWQAKLKTPRMKEMEWSKVLVAWWIRL